MHEWVQQDSSMMKTTCTSKSHRPRADHEGRTLLYLADWPGKSPASSLEIPSSRFLTRTSPFWMASECTCRA